MTIERIEPDKSVVKPEVGNEITPETPMEGIQRYLDEVRESVGARTSDKFGKKIPKGGTFNG